MNKGSFFIFLLLLPILCSCEKRMDIINNGKQDKSCLSIKVIKGAEYYLKRFLFFRGRHKPQMVIWLENSNSDYVSTIYMTQSAAAGDWSTDHDGFRPSCFPVWSHRRGVQTAPGYYMPTREKPLEDGITGATPSRNFQINWSWPADLDPGKYSVWMEVNTSYDYNAKFNQINPDSEIRHPFNGQPSIILSCAIDTTYQGHITDMNIVGHGDVKGNTGTIYHDLSGITSAVDMIRKVIVEFNIY